MSFSGVIPRENPRVLDLCVCVDISLQGLIPKEGKTG